MHCHFTIIYVRAGCVCVFVRQLLLQLWTDRAETLQVYCPYPHLKPETKIFLIGRKKIFRNFWGIASGRGQMSVCACISLTVLIRSSWNFAGVILSLLLTTANKNFFDRTKKKFSLFLGDSLRLGPDEYLCLHIYYSFNPIDFLKFFFEKFWNFFSNL